MTFTYDPSTSRGRVRLIIPDRIDSSHLYEDDEIDTFLTLESANLRRAAALALETAAADNALVLKAMSLMDISTNGPAVASALMARAAQLRKQADDAEAAEDGGVFDIAEMITTDFAWRERLWNEAQRGNP